MKKRTIAIAFLCIILAGIIIYALSINKETFSWKERTKDELASCENRVNKKHRESTQIYRPPVDELNITNFPTNAEWNQEATRVRHKQADAACGIGAFYDDDKSFDWVASCESRHNMFKSDDEGAGVGFPEVCPLGQQNTTDAVAGGNAQAGCREGQHPGIPLGGDDRGTGTGQGVAPAPPRTETITKKDGKTKFYAIVLFETVRRPPNGKDSEGSPIRVDKSILDASKLAEQRMCANLGHPGRDPRSADTPGMYSKGANWPPSKDDDDDGNSFLPSISYLTMHKHIYGDGSTSRSHLHFPGLLEWQDFYFSLIRQNQFINNMVHMSRSLWNYVIKAQDIAKTEPTRLNIPVLESALNTLVNIMAAIYVYSMYIVSMDALPGVPAGNPQPSALPAARAQRIPFTRSGHGQAIMNWLLDTLTLIDTLVRTTSTSKLVLGLASHLLKPFNPDITEAQHFARLAIGNEDQDSQLEYMATPKLNLIVELLLWNQQMLEKYSAPDMIKNPDGTGSAVLERIGKTTGIVEYIMKDSQSYTIQYSDGRFVNDIPEPQLYFNMILQRILSGVEEGDPSHEKNLEEIFDFKYMYTVDDARTTSLTAALKAPLTKVTVNPPTTSMDLFGGIKDLLRNNFVKVAPAIIRNVFNTTLTTPALYDMTGGATEVVYKRERNFWRYITNKYMHRLRTTLRAPGTVNEGFVRTLSPTKLHGLTCGHENVPPNCMASGPYTYEDVAWALGKGTKCLLKDWAIVEIVKSDNKNCYYPSTSRKDKTRAIKESDMEQNMWENAKEVFLPEGFVPPKFYTWVRVVASSFCVDEPNKENVTWGTSNTQFVDKDIPDFLTPPDTDGSKRFAMTQVQKLKQHFDSTFVESPTKRETLLGQWLNSEGYKMGSNANDPIVYPIGGNWNPNVTQTLFKYEAGQYTGAAWATTRSTGIICPTACNRYNQKRYWKIPTHFLWGQSTTQISAMHKCWKAFEMVSLEGFKKLQSEILKREAKNPKEIPDIPDGSWVLSEAHAPSGEDPCHKGEGKPHEKTRNNHCSSHGEPERRRGPRAEEDYCACKCDTAITSACVDKDNLSGVCRDHKNRTVNRLTQEDCERDGRCLLGAGGIMKPTDHNDIHLNNLIKVYNYTSQDASQTAENVRADKRRMEDAMLKNASFQECKRIGGEWFITSSLHPWRTPEEGEQGGDVRCQLPHDKEGCNKNNMYFQQYNTWDPTGSYKYTVNSPCLGRGVKEACIQQKDKKGNTQCTWVEKAQIEGVNCEKVRDTLRKGTVISGAGSGAYCTVIGVRTPDACASNNGQWVEPGDFVGVVVEGVVRPCPTGCVPEAVPHGIPTDFEPEPELRRRMQEVQQKYITDGWSPFADSSYPATKCHVWDPRVFEWSKIGLSMACGCFYEKDENGILKVKDGPLQGSSCNSLCKAYIEKMWTDECKCKAADWIAKTEKYASENTPTDDDHPREMKKVLDSVKLHVDNLNKISAACGIHNKPECANVNTECVALEHSDCVYRNECMWSKKSGMCLEMDKERCQPSDCIQGAAVPGPVLHNEFCGDRTFVGLKDDACIEILNKNCKEARSKGTCSACAWSKDARTVCHGQQSTIDWWCNGEKLEERGNVTKLLKSCNDMNTQLSCNNSYAIDAWDIDGDSNPDATSLEPVLCEWDDDEKKCDVKMKGNSCPVSKLKDLCDGARRSSSGNCQVCVAQHPQFKSCSSHIVDTFCSGADPNVPPPVAETCPHKCQPEHRATCLRTSFPNAGYACGPYNPGPKHTQETSGCPTGYAHSIKQW